MQANKIPAGKCICPQCGGWPELDETGRAYTCYFCCDSGYVDAAIGAQWDRDATDAIEYRTLQQVVDGKHQVDRYDPWSGEGWSEPRPLLPASIFPKQSRVPVLSTGEDDIPF